MKLSDFAARYIARRDVSAGYAKQLMWIVNAYGRTVGQEPLLEHLSDEVLNRHLKCSRDTLAPETRKSHRRALLTLWHAAADEGLLPEPPRRRILAVRAPEKLHEAWTAEEVRQLLAATARLTGYYRNGIAKRLYWDSYIQAAWDSGLRGVDMRRVRADAIQASGVCWLVQHKTGRRVLVQFRPSTLESIRATFPPERELVWPLWARIEVWRREAKALVFAAGLTGSIGRLRHSSGTAVEALYPGHGHEHLGNTRAVFERNYLDRTKVAVARHLPEPLRE